jgi:predicted phage tail protein
MKIFTKKFAIDAAERALNTFAQTLLVVLGAAGLGVTGFEAVEWGGALSVSGAAALVSLLKSVAVATSTTDIAPAPEPVEVPDLDGRHRGPETE